MANKPWLNLGAGHLIMPRQRPNHHALVNADVYRMDREWVNADKFPNDGIDTVMDIFAYPWPWPDNHFGGALAAHIVEHVPHEVRMNNWVTDGSAHVGPDTFDKLAAYGDGFFAFFSELARVLEPGARVHILCPWAFSKSGVIDPTHTRYMMPASFSYLCAPDEDAPFTYDVGSRWTFRSGDSGLPVNYKFETPFLERFHTVPRQELIDAGIIENTPEKENGLPYISGEAAIDHFVNSITEFYVILENLKDG